MNVFKKTALVLALGMAGSAQAATITPAAIAAPAKAAVERVTKTAVVGEDVTFAIAAPSPAAKALQVGDKVVFTLAGAKFNRTNVAAAGDAAITFDNGAAAASATTAYSLNAADTELTVTITTENTANGAANVVFVGSTAAGFFDLTGVAAGTSVTLTAKVVRSLLGNDTAVHTGAASGSIFTVGNFYTAAAVTATTGTITVADDYKKVDGALTKLGAAVATVVADDDILTADTAAGTAIVTISGDMTGVTSIADSTLAGTACDATGTTKTVTAGEYYIDAAAGKAYTCLDNAAAKAAITSTPTYTFNGTSALSTGSFSTTVSYVIGTSDPMGASSTATRINTTLTRNGSAFSVNAAGPLNTIKITDLSGNLTASTGSVSVTAYNAAGAEVTGSVSIPALTSNGTVTIAMETLTTAYPNAVRFDFAVQSSKVLASNVKKASTGTTLTTYTNGSDGAL